MDNNKNFKRPQGISDLHILWAIRDIPKSILNLKMKGALCMMIAAIGNCEHDYYFHSHEDWAKDFGCCVRAVPDYLDTLERIGFISVKRPKNYIKGNSNEYKINYQSIIDMALRFREQRLGSKTCR